MRRRHLLPALLVLASLNAAAAAADPARKPAPATEACLAEAGSDEARRACIGESARACRAALRKPDPVDAALCLNTETGWWRKRLAEAEERMAAKAARLDALHGKAIAEGAPRLTDDLAALREAWKEWAEKRCAFEAMLKRGAPERMIVASECILQLTADQTLLLDRGAGSRRSQ
ncbi:MAG: lysozyme inhibitor LprI family protein [Rubrimonas sp.]|uniref:lysozyme inhibitor LprI family protein n=1 Tax=Rubrimonas sp. TaxID=2036015 RepID=UPI002FDE0064